MHATVRLDVPPPQGTEHSPHADRTDHRYVERHACVLHACSSGPSAAVDPQWDAGTGAPVREDRHWADRNCLPPPQDAEQAEKGPRDQE